MNFSRMILVLVLILVASLGSAFAQAPEGSLDTVVDRFSADNKGLQWVLEDLSAKYRVPIGFVIDSRSTNSANVSVDLEKTPLRLALDFIVSKAPDYRWEFVDGVVNVLPHSLQDELLSTVISKFKFQGGTVDDFRRQITRIPEIRRKAKELGVRFMTLAFSSADFKHFGRDFRLEATNVSLRTLLNLTIVKSGKNFWVASRLGEDNKLVVINLAGL